MLTPTHFRKVIQITAEDSPNVKFARKEQAAGRVPSGREIVPGVLSWAEMCHRLATWDDIRICVGLKAEFYEGADVKMYPKEWLLHSGGMSVNRNRKAKGIGVDPAEGGDKTAMAAVDELGLIALESLKTPDTSRIPDMVAAFAKRYLAQPYRWEQIMFDRGGGGKQHADRLRAMGMREVRTTSFGEAISQEPKLGMVLLSEKKELREDRIYKNRRAEMAYELRLQMDPAGPKHGWCIYPEHLAILRPQMEPIPLRYDTEGKIWLIPKTKGEKAEREEEYDGPTIVKLVGHSPDEWDAVMLALRAMLHKPSIGRAGAG